MMLRPFARAFVLSLAGLVGLGSADILVDGTAKYLPGAAGAGYEAGGIWRTALTDLSGSAILYVDTAGGTSGLVHYDPYGVPRTGPRPVGRHRLPRGEPPPPRPGQPPGPGPPPR